MDGIVQELMVMVGGSATQNRAETTSSKDMSHSDSAFHQIASGGRTDSKPQKAAVATKTEKAIPMDEAEFKDFNG